MTCKDDCICERCGTIWSSKERQELLDFKHRRLEEDLKDAQEEPIDIDYHEYVCGTYCTENGCLGHESDVPIAFQFRGVWFEVAGYQNGEVPWDDPNGVKDQAEYKEVFAALVSRLSKG